MQFSLDRSSHQPLYQQLAQDIQRRIKAGTLPPGTRLPTVRELASQLGVTRLTIHSAYSELQSGGWVEATVGRGTFVAAQFEIQQVFEPAREVSAHNVISDMLRMSQTPGMRSLAMADAAAELFPQREFQQALNEALSDPSSLSYTAAQGDPLLRTAFADWLRQRGLRAGPDEIVVTAGVTQGMALTAQALARPGDTVLVESPTYLGALNIFGSQGLRVVGVPIDQHGMLIDELETLLQSHRPRFIYTIPTFHNPTGICMSAERRASLLAIAARANLPIVEDDIYAALAYEQPVPLALKAADQHHNVIYLTSVSKSLLPGIRLGCIVAPLRLVSRLTQLKQTIDLCSPALLQRALALFLQRGAATNHLRRIVPRYRERRDALLDAMTRWFPAGVRWTVPNGGFSTWVTLPGQTSIVDLYLAAIEQGVAFTPGDVFFSNAAPQPHLRLAFSTQPPEQLELIARQLGDLIGNHLRRRSFTPRPVADWVPLV